jgi:hypothetical protein
MAARSSRSVPVAVVAVASWLLPGLGYCLIGQRTRGLVAGTTIILLYVLGLLIGGVRVIETPGYGDHGQRLMAVGEQVSESTSDSEPAGGTWVIQVHPIDELRNKPWNIPQILAGPIHLAACWGSVIASRPGAPGSPQGVGVRSHARTNELGALFAAIAGMLNLLVIIDASYRAAERGEEP